MAVELNVSLIVPSFGSTLRCRPLLRWLPWVGSPASQLLLRHSDFLLPLLAHALRSLGGSASRRRNRSSQVPRRPSPHMPRSTTPVEPTRAGLRGFAPTSCSLGVAFQVPRLVGLHDSCLSGPDSAACVLAVYASCRSLPSAHARLAFGWRPCLGRAGIQPAGSRSWFQYVLVTYSPPRRGLLGARETAALRREWGQQITSSAPPRAPSPAP